jgi:hypothetical protein
VSDLRPPDAGVEFKSLPEDPVERHEALIAVLGRYVMWLRNVSIAATERHLRSEVERQSVPVVLRQKYDNAAGFSDEDKETCLAIAEASTDRFIRLFLTLLSSTGSDNPLDEFHAIRLKLSLEIVDNVSLALVHEEVVNRGGRKYFADYWGKWINDPDIRLLGPPK